MGGAVFTYSNEVAQMPTGKVKWFSADKGYGFINQDDSPQDVFVHWTAVEGLGNYEELREGESVEFEIEKTDRGLKALNVKRIEQNVY